MAILLHGYYFLLCKQKKSIGFVKIFDFQFLMDLHILGCPEYNLPISGKCVTKHLLQVENYSSEFHEILYLVLTVN